MRRGALDQGEIGQKGHDLAPLHPSGIHPQSAHQHHQRQSRIQQEVRDGIGHGHDPASLLLRPAGGMVGGLEPLPLPALAGQGLDDPDAGGILPQDADHRVHRLLGLGVEGDAPAGHQGDGQEGQQAYRQLDQGQHRLLEEGQHQSAQHQHGRPDAAPLDLVEHLVDVVGVVGQPGHHGGGGEPVHLGAGKGLYPVVQIPAQLPGHLHGDPGGHAVGGDVAGGGSKGQHAHQSAGPPDGRQIPGRHQVIDDRGQQQRQHQL